MTDMPDAENHPAEASAEPADVVDDAAVDRDKATPPKRTRTRAPAVERPYPRELLERALNVPTVLRTHNGGNPWAPSEVAKALGSGMTNKFYYLTAASRDFGLTEGTRDTATISLTDRGRKAVYPTSADAENAARVEAFFSIDLFARVVEYYGGSELPEDAFVRNTLETTFGLDPRVHEEFLDLFRKNCRFVGIGAEWKGTPSFAVPRDGAADLSTIAKPTTPQDRANSAGDELVCFVAMPFSEKTDDYATGFFDEVFASLFKPAIEAAGFVARTAKRQGSDVIQATIINELLGANLVLVDLTEHNPNVLFELGVRMAKELPIALVRAKGTNPIFDVDNLLRVESYNPNLWLSTVEKDVPKLTAHIREAWSRREGDQSYIAMLRRE
jgi:hypothetical protein